MSIEDAREGMGGEMGRREEIEARVDDVEANHPPFTFERWNANTSMRENAPADLRYLLTELARVEAERDAALAKVAAVRAVCDGWENDLFTSAQYAYSQDEAGQHREDYSAIVEALATEEE